MVSVTDRDGLSYERGVQPLAEALRDAGLHVQACRQASHADIAELNSTWAKRLRIPAQRPAWLLIATRSNGPVNLSGPPSKSEE